MTEDTQNRLAALAIAAIAISVVLPLTEKAVAGPEAPLDCRDKGADTQVHDLHPSQHAAARSAYRVLFPQASKPPTDDELAAEAKVRCGDGKLLVCFVGANLPCDRLNTARANAGADEFCRDHRQAGEVPLAATGHDTLFGYRCEAGRAVVARQAYHLDGQGFARELWAAAETPPDLATSAADPIEQRSKACFASPDAQTTIGMAVCSHEAYLAYDRQLNEIYRDVLKHVDPASGALIREAQRRWVAAQAADEAADNGPWRNDRGSMATPEIEALKVDAIRQRIAKLRSYR